MLVLLLLRSLRPVRCAAVLQCVEPFWPNASALVCLQSKAAPCVSPCKATSLQSKLPPCQNDDAASLQVLMHAQEGPSMLTAAWDASH